MTKPACARTRDVSVSSDEPVTRPAGEPVIRDDEDMKIRLNQPVSSTDGPFGELGDIVVDPTTMTVTHLVVEPHHRHYQARLVPMTLVDFVDDEVRVRLDEQHLRALQGVAATDFVHIYQPIDLGPEWDVGVENIKAWSYSPFPYDYGGPGLTDYAGVDFDRVPKGECEIRRLSDVTSSDDHIVGTVDSLIVDGDHVDGVLVQTGMIGLRHRVALPMSTVQQVRNDEICLKIDRDTFKRLTPVDDLERTSPGRLESVEHRVAGAVKKLAATVRSKVGRG